jgi:hypothetical protein
MPLSLTAGPQCRSDPYPGSTAPLCLLLVKHMPNSTVLMCLVGLFLAAFAFKKPKANQRGGKPIGALGQSCFFFTKLTAPSPMLLPAARWATSKNYLVATGYKYTGSFFSPPPPLTSRVGLPIATLGLPSTAPSMEARVRRAAGDEHAGGRQMTASSEPGHELISNNERSVSTILPLFPSDPPFSETFDARARSLLPKWVRSTAGGRVHEDKEAMATRN